MENDQKKLKLDAAQNIRKYEPLTEENLIVKRTGTKISPWATNLKRDTFLIEFAVFGGFASLNPPYKLTLAA